jgi:hypothetical protein
MAFKKILSFLKIQTSKLPERSDCTIREIRKGAKIRKIKIRGTINKQKQARLQHYTYDDSKVKK